MTGRLLARLLISWLKCRLVVVQAIGVEPGPCSGVVFVYFCSPPGRPSSSRLVLGSAEAVGQPLLRVRHPKAAGAVQRNQSWLLLQKEILKYYAFFTQVTTMWARLNIGLLPNDLEQRFELHMAIFPGMFWTIWGMSLKCVHTPNSHEVLNAFWKGRCFLKIQIDKVVFPENSNAPVLALDWGAPKLRWNWGLCLWWWKSCRRGGKLHRVAEWADRPGNNSEMDKSNTMPITCYFYLNNITETTLLLPFYSNI